MLERLLVAALLATLAAGCGDVDEQDAGLTCEQSCPLSVDLACENGPPSEADCVEGCTASREACPAEFDALTTCGGPTPELVCDRNGSVAVVGCEEELAALATCASF